MNAIIVEDETKSQVHLSRLLRAHCPEVQLSGIAASLQEAEDLVVRLKPELVFLDIELGKDSGFSLLEKTRNRDFSYGVIFTTAYEKYGIRAIKFSALDYLLKPVKAEELVRAVQKAREHQLEQKQLEHLLQLLELKSGHEQTIAIPLHHELRFVQLSAIVQVSGLNNYSVITLDSKEQLTVSKGLFHFDSLLIPAGFVRVHQSYIVNPRHVHSLLKKGNINEIKLSNGSTLPVSRLRLDYVKELLLKKRG